jgi:hypothetical protein
MAHCCDTIQDCNANTIMTSLMVGDSCLLTQKVLWLNILRYWLKVSRQYRMNVAKITTCNNLEDFSSESRNLFFASISVSNLWPAYASLFWFIKWKFKIHEFFQYLLQQTTPGLMYTQPMRQKPASHEQESHALLICNIPWTTKHCNHQPALYTIECGLYFKGLHIQASAWRDWEMPQQI